MLAATLGLIELGVLEYTYTRLGIGHRFFTGLLLASLVGSVVNLPVTVRAGRAADPAQGLESPAAGHRNGRSR